MSTTGAPTLALSILNWTLPVVGNPVPVTGLTVAVNVMFWPRLAVGVRLLVTTVLVARSTFWLKARLVLPTKLMSPL